jgi:hypothetical protein
MSAYIMEEAGFLLLADELASYAEYSNNRCDLKHELARIVREFLGFPSSCFGAPDDAHPEASLVAQELYNLNVRAVNERYEDSDETPIQLSFVRRFHLPGWTPAQLYKNLLCLRYQMSEGDVPETELYKKVSVLMNEIALAIVTNSDDYENASWGWEIEEAQEAA